jgi:hypothetical protein
MRLLAHAPSAEQLANPETCQCPAEGCPHPDLTAPQPAKEWGKKSDPRKDWNIQHFGQQYQKPPLVGIPLGNVMIDPLHLLLGLIRILWEYTIEVHIHSSELAEYINSLLKVR